MDNIVLRVYENMQNGDGFSFNKPNKSIQFIRRKVLYSTFFTVLIQNIRTTRPYNSSVTSLKILELSRFLQNNLAKQCRINGYLPSISCSLKEHLNRKKYYIGTIYRNVPTLICLHIRYSMWADLGTYDLEGERQICLIQAVCYFYSNL